MCHPIVQQTLADVRGSYSVPFSATKGSRVYY